LTKNHRTAQRLKIQSSKPTTLFAIDTHYRPTAFAFAFWGSREAGARTRVRSHIVSQTRCKGGAAHVASDSQRRRRKASPPKRADSEWGAKPRDAKRSAATLVGHRQGDVRT
jgi:hypothetical protein